MGVTIKDVAKEANVSPSTVSRVIAGSDRISEETKKRVKVAIQKLNYHPNVVARSLTNKMTKVIGIVLPSKAEQLFKNPFFIYVMTGISKYAQESRYYIMYTFFKTEEEKLTSIQNYINSNLVDGIILTTVHSKDSCIKYLQEREFPFVVIGRPEDTKNVLWVDNDNFQAMYNVLSKLFMKGHRKIAFIGAKSELNVSKDRLSGYKQAHKINGVDIDENSIIEVEDFREVLGYNAMKKILNGNKPTAVVCTDDLLAFGASSYLVENNMKGISIVGFNNIPLAEYQKPALTSVDINAKELGYYAAKMLVDKLEKNITNMHYIIETNLIERESTNY
ncbi:LacI family DNA-binding transcriptional regulator [Crassaminicella profunda]|uniref:LacI family DNA-binding transcriptional regulator n=1 Tax=Crassaminicella profunda TaxID=1286698 RepID=UPI001CA6B14E|nr:LacI family DNA-binding transcriptional regulator [Crassaminicella profunda]QZY57305.1 LacI family transcriptional regulator [Crassaminicella profunda]